MNNNENNFLSNNIIIRFIKSQEFIPYFLFVINKICLTFINIYIINNNNYNN